MLVEIYYKIGCPFSIMAEKKMQELRIKGQEMDLRIYENCYPGVACYEEMKKRSKKDRPTYPQIFVDDKHIGGYTDLLEHLKNNNGKL